MSYNLNAQSDVLELLGNLPPGVTITVKPAGLHGFVVGFVRSQVEVDSIGAIALKASKPEGALSGWKVGLVDLV